jgi:hypothetical protein
MGQVHEVGVAQPGSGIGSQTPLPICYSDHLA